MLRSEKYLLNFTLKATDGEIGTVEDILFDDATWTLRYFSIDTGGWLTERLVLVSPAAISGMPDWKSRQIPVELTKDQVRNSPKFEQHKPISKRKEEELTRYYSWPVYWGQTVSAPHRAARTSELKARFSDKDSTLRSCSEITGYRVYANDGEMGTVDDFILDDESWGIRYLAIDTGNWLPGKKVLVPPSWVSKVRWSDRHISVDASRQEIENSPAYHPDQAINRKQETRLYDYYGRPKYWQGDAPTPIF